MTSTERQFAYLKTPVGLLEIAEQAQHIVHIFFVEQTHTAAQCNPLLTEAKAQLLSYLEGKLQRFDLPMAPQGTEFQQQVWQALRQIPYGTTCSYQDIALALGNANSVRAVGAANGKNPISIIVPCHRVIGKSGKLTGYAGGLSRKAWLLDLEARHTR